MLTNQRFLCLSDRDHLIGFVLVIQTFPDLIIENIYLKTEQDRSIIFILWILTVILSLFIIQLLYSADII